MHSPSWTDLYAKGGVQSLLASYSKDSDPRVRTSALQALVREHYVSWYVNVGCNRDVSRFSNYGSSGPLLEKFGGPLLSFGGPANL